jgi:predicted aspartyl protease
MVEMEDSEGNIILMERMDGHGGVQAHINGRDVNAHVQSVHMDPSGALDVRLQIDGPVQEDEEVGRIGA